MAEKSGHIVERGRMKILRFGLVFFVIATVLMSIAAMLEITSKQQDSVSGFMILSVYAQAPWSFSPKFLSFSQYISDLFFKLIANTLTSYIVEILITGFCWFLDGIFIGLAVQLFKTMGAKKF